MKVFIKMFRQLGNPFLNKQPDFRAFQRILSSGMSTKVSVPQRQKETFQDVLPSIVHSLTNSPKLSQMPEVSQWIQEILDYNLRGGKKARGLTTVLAYESFERPQCLTEDTLRQARIMGWCVEIAYLLVLDDIMDNSSTRRGVPCWYTLPNVGLGAINDSVFLYASIFEIMKNYFSEHPQYTNFINLFNETLMYTTIGQNLDYSMAHRIKSDYSLFTIERYNAIVKYKTAYYSYKLPVFLGMLMANNVDKNLHKEVEEICINIGHFFQIQDDYIDCFGDESVTGKAGTDIQEGKCSWPAVAALQRCTPAQQTVFTACYGSKEPAHVERIKRLYDQLGLPQVYAEQEREFYDKIVQRINALSSKVENPQMSDLFIKLLDMIYKRKQ